MTEGSSLTEAQLDQALAAMGKFHILGHADMTKDFTPESCPFCAGIFGSEEL